MKPLLYENYRKNGKVNYLHEYMYNTEGMLIEERKFWKGQLRSKTINVYNEQEQLINVKKYSKNDQLERDVNLKYVL